MKVSVDLDEILGHSQRNCDHKGRIIHATPSLKDQPKHVCMKSLTCREGIQGKVEKGYFSLLYFLRKF